MSVLSKYNQENEYLKRKEETSVSKHSYINKGIDDISQMPMDPLNIHYIETTALKNETRKKWW